MPASRRRFLTHVGAWIAAPITQRRASTPARPGPLMIDRATWLEHFDGHVVDGCAVGTPSHGSALPMLGAILLALTRRRRHRP